MIFGTVAILPHSAKGDVEEPASVEAPQEIPNALPTTKAALQELAIKVSVEHGMSKARQSLFLATEACEIKKLQVGTTTVWDYKAQSDYIHNGVREDSWGPWQINLPGKDITRAQAIDPVWATEWAATQFVNGQARQWTCARNILD